MTHLNFAAPIEIFAALAPIGEAAKAVARRSSDRLSRTRSSAVSYAVVIEVSAHKLYIVVHTYVQSQFRLIQCASCET